MNIIFRRIGFKDFIRIFNFMILFAIVFSLLNLLIVSFSQKKSAYAAAWTRSDGELWTSYEFTLASNDNSYFVGESESNPERFYSKKEYIAYGEYGLTDYSTLGLKINRQDLHSKIRYPGAGSGCVDGICVHNKRMNGDIYGEVFLRNKYFDNGRSVFSGYTLYGVPIKYDKKNSTRYNFRNTRHALELGLSYGFTLDGDKINRINGYEGFYPDTNHFVNLQASYRKLFDSFYDEVHLDATLGLKMNSSSMMLFEVFHTYSVYSEGNYDIGNVFKSVTEEEAYAQGNYAVVPEVNAENNYSLINENTKVKISSVVKFSDKTSIQLSVFKTFTNVNEETGFGLSLWYGF